MQAPTLVIDHINGTTITLDGTDPRAAELMQQGSTATASEPPK